MAKSNMIRNALEIVMASSEKSDVNKKTAMIKDGKLRKIAPKVYTTNP